MMKKYTIAGLGEVLWDIYGEQKFLGGAPANFAAHVQQAKHRGLVLSRVGQDDLGKTLCAALAEMGLDVAAVQIDPWHPTGTVKVTLDQAGVPSFACTKNVAFDYLEFDKKWQLLAAKIDAVLFGTLAQRNEKSHQTIMDFLSAASRAIKIYDINLRGWNERTKQVVESSLKKADVIKLNDEELAALQRVFNRTDTSHFVLELLRKYDLRLAAVTLGKGGAIIWSGENRYYSPGFQVDVVDTTGSGDAFAAGLVIKMLQGAPIAEMAEFANLLGAFVATRQGAVPKWVESDLDNIRTNCPRVHIKIMDLELTIDGGNLI